MRSNILVVTPTLGPDVLATARILDNADVLEALITRTVVPSNIAWLLSMTTLTRNFSRRSASPVERKRTQVVYLADLIFYIVLAVKRSRITATDASFAHVDTAASKRVGFDLKAVFAREDCCVRTFQRAKSVGTTTVYQLPTAYWRFVKELADREIDEFPGACNTAEDLSEFASRRTQRKEAELDLADHVLCPSSFVCNSLERYRPGDYQVIPFAIEPGEWSDHTVRKPVFLYAGNITMRKGVHRLLRAWKRLKAYRTHELRLIGDMHLSAKFLNDFRGKFTHLPRLSANALNQHYRESSAFVFNSMADGFGHVILEAMNAGTPVIASRNSGAPDVIENQINGLLIDYGSDDQLDAALEWALAHPRELAQLGHNGFETAQRRTWKEYATEFLGWLHPILR